MGKEMRWKRSRSCGPGVYLTNPITPPGHKRRTQIERGSERTETTSRRPCYDSPNRLVWLLVPLLQLKHQKLHWAHSRMSAGFRVPIPTEFTRAAFRAQSEGTPPPQPNDRRRSHATSGGRCPGFLDQITGNRVGAVAKTEWDLAQRERASWTFY